MEYTAIDSVTAVPRPAADRAGSYGLPPIVVDGNDADAMYVAASTALDLARSGGGPSLIEALTYRHGGHSRADPGKYRPQAEVDEWLAKDPIPAYRSRLLDSGVSSDDLDAIEAKVRAAVEEATEAAKAGAAPSLDLIDKDVWADGSTSWRN
jgi:acetoin:2,6-dichlorophenolindophenol oxidoreductase subunit alpha